MRLVTPISSRVVSPNLDGGTSGKFFIAMGLHSYRSWTPQGTGKKMRSSR
jgi:hypothetical protein